MVLLREILTNRLHLNEIHKLKRVKRLSNDAYSSTSSNVPEHARRSGLFFVLFSIIVITIFSILFVYCFLIEYRLIKIIAKINEFEKRQKALEEMVERLTPKMENSKYMEHGNLKQPNEIQNTPKRDLELPASEAHHIKVYSRDLFQSPRLDDKLINTNNVYNAGTSNTDASITPTKIVFPKIRIRRSGLKKKKKFSEKQLANTSLSSVKRDRTAARFPLIHLENNSSSFREKSEVGSSSFNFWKEADWVNKFTKDNFQLDSFTGHVVVKKSGAYLVYVQIVYHDAIGRWSAGIDVNGKVRAKCLESEQLKDIENYSQENHGVYKQCSISTVVHLLEKQSVSIKCMYGYRTLLTQPEFTFWGMVKLA